MGRTQMSRFGETVPRWHRAGATRRRRRPPLQSSFAQARPPDLYHGTAREAVKAGGAGADTSVEAWSRKEEMDKWRKAWRELWEAGEHHPGSPPGDLHANFHGRAAEDLPVVSEAASPGRPLGDTPYAEKVTGR